MALKLKEVFGPRTLLGSDSLQSLLLLVLRNASTDSPWPISSNPFAKYNEDKRDDCNLKLPLWQLVRASTAAPTYFPPEVFQVGKRQFVFVDGGITMYNNPAFQLFLMATLDRYWPFAPEGRQGWPTGVGQDAACLGRHGHEPRRQHQPDARADAPAVQRVQRSVGPDVRGPERAGPALPGVRQCLAGDPIDREIGNLIGSSGPLAAL